MTIRSAWLVLPGSPAQQLMLDDPDTGYAMTQLDLGAPQVREVVNNWPARDGTSDRSQFLGSRVVTANITAWPGGDLPMDDIVRLFAPYIHPRVRPELHFVLDTVDGDERVLILRASTFAAPIGVPIQRDFQLTWVAPDPILRDAEVSQVIAWAGSSTLPGRGYNLTFARIYPPGGSSPNDPYFVVGGDVPVRPRCLLYGPITAPSLMFSDWTIGRQTLTFDPGVVVNAGHYIELDLDKHSCRMDGDPSQDMLQALSWGETWPLLYPGGAYVSYRGSTTSGVTQAQILWQEGYLS